jgi:molybdate transport system regulatory protein
MRVVHKIWLDDGGKAFGEGPYLLLVRVAETGSLRQAAAELDMSYNKAWHLVRGMEARLGFPLLERHVGGSAGGGSALTPEAQDLVARYEGLMRDVDAAVERLYRRHFGDLFQVDESP